MSPIILEPELERKRTDNTRSSQGEWVPAGSFSPAFKKTIQEQLKRLRLLESNWDCEGAPQIDRRILAAANRFAARLPTDVVKAPVVVPLANGNLEFEWNDGPRTLQFEFESPETIRYLKWHPQAGIEEEDSFSVRDAARAATLMRWFANSTRVLKHG